MHNLLSNVLLGFGIVFVLLFFYALFKNKNRLSAVFSLLCLFMSIYIIGYAFELKSSDYQSIKFFLEMEYFGLSFIPALWLMLSYKYYFNKNMSVLNSVIVSVIPYLTFFFNTTNDYHHLLYKSISIIEQNGNYLAVFEKGIWYYVFAIYSFAAVLTGSYIFFNSWRYTGYNKNTQCFWLFFATLWPVISGIAYVLDFGPQGYDILSFSFIITCISFFIVLFKYDFLEFKEIVRSYAFGQIKEGIMVIDNENRIMDFNNSGQKIFAWLSSSNIGESVMLFKEGKKIIENTEVFFEIDLKRRGVTTYYEFRVSPLTERGKKIGRIFLFTDITEEKLAIERLNYLATYDSLSDIYNRNKLIEELEYYLHCFQRHNTIFSVLMIDIDYFKLINDRHGHIIGDMVIKNIVKLCKSKLRSGDVIGRYGGEEFVIIMPETDLEQACDIAESVRKHIAQTEMNLNGIKFVVTVSIGVVLIAGENKHITSNDLLNAVDKALYEAKNSGRNNVKAYNSIDEGLMTKDETG